MTPLPSSSAALLRCCYRRFERPGMERVWQSNAQKSNDASLDTVEKIESAKQQIKTHAERVKQSLTQILDDTQKTADTKKTEILQVLNPAKQRLVLELQKIGDVARESNIQLKSEKEEYAKFLRGVQAEVNNLIATVQEIDAQNIVQKTQAIRVAMQKIDDSLETSSAHQSPAQRSDARETPSPTLAKIDKSKLEKELKGRTKPSSRAAADIGKWAQGNVMQLNTQSSGLNLRDPNGKRIITIPRQNTGMIKLLDMKQGEKVNGFMFVPVEYGDDTQKKQGYVAAEYLQKGGDGQTTAPAAVAPAAASAGASRAATPTAPPAPESPVAPAAPAQQSSLDQQSEQVAEVTNKDALQTTLAEKLRANGATSASKENIHVSAQAWIMLQQKNIRVKDTKDTTDTDLVYTSNNSEVTLVSFDNKTQHIALWLLNNQLVVATVDTMNDTKKTARYDYAIVDPATGKQKEYRAGVMLVQGESSNANLAEVFKKIMNPAFSPIVLQPEKAETALSTIPNSPAASADIINKEEKCSLMLKFRKDAQGIDDLSHLFVDFQSQDAAQQGHTMRGGVQAAQTPGGGLDFTFGDNKPILTQLELRRYPGDTTITNLITRFKIPQDKQEDFTTQLRQLRKITEKNNDTFHPDQALILAHKTDGGNWGYIIMPKTQTGQISAMSICGEGGDFASHGVEKSGTVRKPVIYLYPTEQTRVRVELNVNGEVTVEYPRREEGAWDVEAWPDGRLWGVGNENEWRYLYYEAMPAVPFETAFRTGFCVARDESVSFLEATLRRLGLNAAERGDMITYWLPTMQRAPYTLVRFLFEEYERVASLHITPTPDTVLRVFMLLRSSDSPVSIAEQDLPTMERKGFVVVEWGGTDLDEGKTQ